MTRAAMPGASNAGIRLLTWRPGRALRGLAVLAAITTGASWLGGLGCTGKRGGPSREGASVVADAATPGPVPAPLSSGSLIQINGQSFPDQVIALTWDDGPDRGTLALAEYLSRQKISATFFVVSEWSRDLSSDPGEGTGVYETGFVYLRILEQLVSLGHRLGNHTLNHRILTEIDPQEAALQVRSNQEQIDPLLTNELRLFRPPGGAWNAAVASAIGSDAYLKGLVGPVRWDVDRKDWESSRACASDRPTEDCESAGAPGLAGLNRVKPLVLARRYLESIEEAKRGIVLLHDRVGHVGSSYAIELARALVPQLKARGFVFAAPVLGFSPLTRRAAREAVDAGTSKVESSPSEGALVGIADVDGDRRADLCVRDSAGVLCSLSTELVGSATDRVPRAVFHGRSRWDLSFGGADWAPPERARSIQLADVNGDRLADLCGMRKDGIVCALATSPLAFAAPRAWLAGAASAASHPGLLLGDVDGDGKADACGRSPAGIVCARSLGKAFGPSRPWLGEMTGEDASEWSPDSIALADVDGDGRADACGRGPRGIECALSRRTSFAHTERWSSGEDFSDGDAVPWAKSPAYGGTIRFGDLNGDGRADVCGRGPTGIACALSTGRGFTRATLWLGAGMTDADGWLDPALAAGLRLGDINGDGRADLCADSPAGVVCGLAP